MAYLPLDVGPLVGEAHEFPAQLSQLLVFFVVLFLLLLLVIAAPRLADRELVPRDDLTGLPVHKALQEVHVTGVVGHVVAVPLPEDLLLAPSEPLAAALLALGVVHGALAHVLFFLGAFARGEHNAGVLQELVGRNGDAMVGGNAQRDAMPDLSGARPRAARLVHRPRDGVAALENAGLRRAQRQGVLGHTLNVRDLVALEALLEAVPDLLGELPLLVEVGTRGRDEPLEAA
mmetsp:Transcript_5945/g.16996  ORF Transcript_5945/g.16996 Transcript_5945/m.16996 type:complete len:232 (+) Transcript_5945:383-1078(+)